jgi:hypothetical protein
MGARGMSEDLAFVIVNAINQANSEFPFVPMSVSNDPAAELLKHYRFGKAVIAALDAKGLHPHSETG